MCCFHKFTEENRQRRVETLKRCFGLSHIAKKPNITGVTHRCIPLVVSCLLVTMAQSSTAGIPNPEDVYRSLAFVFDTTGSMVDDYLQLQSHAEQIMTYVQKRNDTDIKHFVFVPFNDPDVGPVSETSDPNVILEKINQVVISGGDDCPEMGITAVIQALKVVKPNSYIYVFTDASVKDWNLVDKALELIQRKQSQVVVLRTGNCGWPDMSYERIASLGSGNVFDVRKNDLSTVLNFIKTSMDTNRVNLLSVDVPKRQLNPTPKNLYIDESIKSFLVSVSGVKPNIDLVDPTGKTIDKELMTDLDLKNVKIVKILDPVSGEWQLYVTSESPHTIRVAGVSTNNFDFGFAISEPKNMTQTSHRPLKGTNNYVLIDCPDVQKFVSCSIQELNSGENKTESLPIFQFRNNTSMLLCGPFLPGDKPFYVQIFGKNNNGNYFRRITKTSIIPDEPDVPYITTPKNIIVELGDELIIDCHVESLVPFTVTWKSSFNNHTKPPLNFNQSSVVKFYVQNATLQHRGTYTCVAQNTAGLSKSTIDVDVISKPTINEGNDNVTVILYEGEDYSMTCMGDGTPSPRMEWSFNDSKNIFIYDVLRLIIFDATPSDSNVYTCRASNKDGVTEKHYNVIVQVNSTKSLANEMLIINEFDDVYMRCPLQYANGQWSKDGFNINDVFNKRADEQHYKTNGRALKIFDIETSDSAVYTCANSSSIYSFDVKVAFPPYFLKNQVETMMLKRNETVLFDCTSNGYPTPIVRWRKKESALPVTQWTLSGVEFSENKQKLKIHSIDWIHNGTYSCIVRNKLGHEKRDFELLVF